MEIGRRALYNLIRMNWERDRTLAVEDWQVEDYRSLSLNVLFERLSEFDIQLDRSSFIAFAESVDSPEDLADHIIDDDELEPEEQDQIYLIVFELWRRLVKDTLCLSVFCDELDHQINEYDQGKLTSLEPLQDALANLQEILDENTDEGVEPHAVFHSVIGSCANDLQSFLFDFISDQIDEGNRDYAGDLIDGFTDYVLDNRWLEFLRARLVGSVDWEASLATIRSILGDNESDPDLELNLEILSFLADGGESSFFLEVVQSSIRLLAVEEDLIDLLNIAIDFCDCLDLQEEKRAVQALKVTRRAIPADEPVQGDDPIFEKLLSTFESTSTES